MKRFFLKIHACYRILFSRNPIVMLWNSGRNVIVSKDDLSEEMDWKIIYLNVQDEDEAIDIIFDVADSLEISELDDLYPGISAN